MITAAPLPVEPPSAPHGTRSSSEYRHRMASSSTHRSSTALRCWVPWIPICTSSRVVACNTVYISLSQYVKYKLYLFENICLLAIVQISSERGDYWLRIGTRSSSKAREGGW